MLIGDIVGKPGREIVCRAVPLLIEREELDLVVANAENAAGGSGITPAIYRELIAAGVDAITLGDHIYRRAEIMPVLESEPNIVKPANFPAEVAGRELAVVTARNGVRGRHVLPAGPPVHEAGRLSVAGGRSRAWRACPATSACGCSIFTPKPPATCN